MSAPMYHKEIPFQDVPDTILQAFSLHDWLVEAKYSRKDAIRKGQPIA